MVDSFKLLLRPLVDAKMNGGWHPLGETVPRSRLKERVHAKATFYLVKNLGVVAVVVSLFVVVVVIVVVVRFAAVVFDSTGAALVAPLLCFCSMAVGAVRAGPFRRWLGSSHQPSVSLSHVALSPTAPALLLLSHNLHPRRGGARQCSSLLF